LAVEAEDLVNAVVPCRQIWDDGIRTARNIGQHLGQGARWGVYRHGDGETLDRQLRQSRSVGHNHLSPEGDGLHNGDGVCPEIAHQNDDIAGLDERTERLPLCGVERSEGHRMVDL
jgi:hypothetical protein